MSVRTILLGIRNIGATNFRKPGTKSKYLKKILSSQRLGPIFKKRTAIRCPSPRPELGAEGRGLDQTPERLSVFADVFTGVCSNVQVRAYRM